MFGLIPTFTNNLASRDNSFKSIFDVFNEPFFQNAFAPVNSMFNAFKVDVKDTDNAYETIEVGQSAAHIYNQLYRNCSNLPYTPYGDLADSKEEKTYKNENNYDLL